MIATGVMSGRVNAPTIKDYQGEAKQEIQPPASTPKPVPEVRMVKKIYSRAEITTALTAVVEKYGLDYDKFSCTVEDESQFDPYNKGPGGLSVGLAMYILPTWLGSCSKTDDRTNPYKSLECMGKMWKAGQEGQWDSYCNMWAHPVCKKRGLYPGFLGRTPSCFKK